MHRSGVANDVRMYAFVREAGTVDASEFEGLVNDECHTVTAQMVTTGVREGCIG